jgi:serine/threonine protein kinase
MVRPDGYAKVLDFGLAKLTELRISDSGMRNEETEALMQSSQSNPQGAITNPQLTDTGAVMGTVAYMSPEQALGQEVDHRTDIFSLGIVLYEMTAGAHPFKGPTAAATFDALLNRDPPAPIISNPDMSPELERIIGRALEKDRELRYQTASDLRAELKRWQRTLDSSPIASGRILARTNGVARTTRRARVLKAAFALVALLVVAAVIFVAWRRLPRQETTAPLRNLSFAQLYRPSNC